MVKAITHEFSASATSEVAVEGVDIGEYLHEMDYNSATTGICCK